jgi:hypothetical protein
LLTWRARAARPSSRRDRRLIDSSFEEGDYVDQLSQYRNPLYATSAEPASNKDKLESYATPSPVKELTKAQKDADTATKRTGEKYDARPRTRRTSSSSSPRTRGSRW